ncbi:Ankyrin repeat containing protein [Gracilaria domingensis]|nr:Ankyrin repeat containing protein [Gracilaria domingensis]
MGGVHLVYVQFHRTHLFHVGLPLLARGEVHSGAEVINSDDSTSGSSTDPDPDDDDSDSDLMPPPPAPCRCLLCTDVSPLVERSPRERGSAWDDSEACRRNISPGAETTRPICSFCSGGGRLFDGRAGLAVKLGRSRITWSQRIAATEAPALLHPGGGPPDGSVGSSLSAVILSAQLGKPSCLGLLLKRCQPNLNLTYGKRRLTALAWACHKGSLQFCQLLREHGENPATNFGEAVTALHLDKMSRPQRNKRHCVSQPKRDTPRLPRSCSIPALTPLGQDEGKYTPGHLGIVTIVDTTTTNEVTPLHYAVQGGHSQVVQALISSGAKVNCSKKPLLMIAADDGKLDVVNLLLNADASINCRANNRAVLDKETEVCDYLTPLHLSSSKNHHEVVDALIQRWTDFNALTLKSEWSALDFSVLNGHSESAIILLQHGAIVSDTCKSIMHFSDSWD